MFPFVKTETAKDFKFDPNMYSYICIYEYILFVWIHSVWQETKNMMVSDKNLYDTNSAQLVEHVGS